MDFSLRTSAGTFSDSLGVNDVRFTCPDGTIYAMDVSTAYSCKLDKLDFYWPAVYNQGACVGLQGGERAVMFCGAVVLP
jgi:hypothetical protein